MEVLGGGGVGGVDAEAEPESEVSGLPSFHPHAPCVSPQSLHLQRRRLCRLVQGQGGGGGEAVGGGSGEDDVMGVGAEVEAVSGDESDEGVDTLIRGAGERKGVGDAAHQAGQEMAVEEGGVLGGGEEGEGATEASEGGEHRRGLWWLPPLSPHLTRPCPQQPQGVEVEAVLDFHRRGDGRLRRVHVRVRRRRQPPVHRRQHRRQQRRGRQQHRSGGECG